jgi:hypothetical protein
VQQEAPEEINRALVSFLQRQRSVAGVSP